MFCLWRGADLLDCLAEDDTDAAAGKQADFASRVHA